MDTPTLIPIEKIDANPYQPRQAEDPAVTAEIAESIRRNGLMQVPTARQVNGRFQLAFGHTRLAAFRLLQEECMPLIVRELDDLQMFELGVSENIKRRDLNPIEQAESMRRYMQEFGKTSVQAGEFFNVSEEQVRGTVRLINLVPEAQQALKEGKINITTARALLSMQKVASPAAIAETVKQIEKGEDRWGNQELPEKIIEESVEHLEEVVDLWDDNRDGKPRAGYHGWLLSMKNFPNKYLTPLTPVDAAVALGIQNDEEAMEDVGEYLSALYQPGDYGDVEDAQAAAQYRQERLIARDRSLWDKLQHLLNPPACSACPFYTRLNGSHFCGMKTCHTRKTEAWKEHVLQAAVKDLGIPPYVKEDGKYQVLSYEHEKLFTARNKDLRLVRKDQAKGYHWQSWKGVDDNLFLVVMTGKTLQDKTAALKEATASEKAQLKAEDKKDRLLQDARHELYWEATVSLKAMFAELPLYALHTLVELNFAYDADLPNGVEEPVKNASDDERATFLRRQLCLAMLEEKDTFELRRSWGTAGAVSAWLIETAAIWGIKMHKSLQGMAARLDEEIAAVTAETVKAKKNGKKP